jgi:hypothetical protein
MVKARAEKRPVTRLRGNGQHGSDSEWSGPPVYRRARGHSRSPDDETLTSKERTGKELDAIQVGVQRSPMWCKVVTALEAAYERETAAG